MHSHATVRSPHSATASRFARFPSSDICLGPRSVFAELLAQRVDLKGRLLFGHGQHTVGEAKALMAARGIAVRT